MADVPKKILVVEDNDMLANMYTTYLKLKGFDTKRVSDGEMALSTTLEYRPDLILLDVMMPKISGFDVLDILRNTPKTGGIPIIILTALSEKTDREKASNLGVNDYLEKSQTDLSTIVTRIRKQLKMDEK